MVAILHEGNSKKTNDNELVKLLISHLNLDENEVEFFGMNSKSNFFKENSSQYMVLNTKIQDETISKILFIVDADYEENDCIYGGYDNTKIQIEKIIEQLKLKDLSEVYITCDPSTKSGYLESLILSSIPPEQKECIDNFLKCSNFKSKENHKAILNQIYKNAYPNAPYNFEHSNFDEIKLKLNDLFSKQKI